MPRLAPGAGAASIVSESPDLMECGHFKPDVARTTHIDIVGDRMTVQNLRNFDYRSETDFTERWETRTFDLSKLSGLDLFMSYWGAPGIAHTIMSWDLSCSPNSRVRP